MNKVFIVEEVYNFENEIETKVSVYDSEEKATDKFNQLVKVEKEESWIAYTLKHKEKEEEFELDDQEGFFYCYDYDEGYSTSICIQEKEVW